MQDILQAAGQYRETKASMYRASENAAAEPEYIPWTGKTNSSKLLFISFFIPRPAASAFRCENERLVVCLSSEFGPLIPEREMTRAAVFKQQMLDFGP